MDSSHWINVENQNAIAAFTPDDRNEVRHAPPATVTVTDGRLTLSPAGGTNTKITTSTSPRVDRAGRPYTEACTPPTATNRRRQQHLATDNT